MAAPHRDDIAHLSSELARHGAKDSNPFVDVDEDEEALELNEFGVDED